MTTRRRSRRARRGGFTLIEVMISLGIMTVGAMAMIALQQHTIRSNSHARQLATATQIAQQWIERIKQDAHTWNVAGTNDVLVQNALARTRYLLNVANATNRGLFRSPTYDPAQPMVSNVYDFRGTPLPQDNGVDDDGIRFSDRVFFCTSYRTNWVYYGRAARVEVRVWWPRDHAGGNTAAIANWCADTDDGAGGGVVDPAVYHIVYLSTVVRMNPVLR